MIQNLIPALEWLRTYKIGNLRGDLSAGLIVAIMLLPQSMAYAMLAGLPSFSIPEFSADSMMLLLPSSIAIVFVGFMESIAVAELVAAKEK